MPATSERQSRRIGQRRKGEAQPTGTAEIRYVRENFSPEEMRHARVVMVLSALVFLGGCLVVVVAAGGQFLAAYPFRIH